MSISRRQVVSVAGAGIASMVAPNRSFSQNSEPIRPDVTQLRAYDKTEFLKNPIHSRDCPPAKSQEQ